MRRNGARFALISVGKMGHQTLLLRLSAVLRNAVVMCRPLITPDNCWHKTTWPEFQSSLPPGLVDGHTTNNQAIPSGNLPRNLVRRGIDMSGFIQLGKVVFTSHRCIADADVI